MDAFKCSDCHMTFGTVGLLQKHKRKFCVGGSLGDPDNLLLRKGLYSADTPRQRPLSPDDRPLEGSEIVSKKVNQLRAFKDKREKLRDIRNLEERLLLDNLEDTERKIGDSPRSPRRTRSRLPLSRHPEVRDLQIEYERLKDQEDRTVGYGGPLPPPVREMENISPMSDTSMSIHLPGESKQFGRLGTQDIGTRALELRIKADYPHYNPNQEAQLRQLAENHGRQMEYLQIKNRDLEKQREDIRRRLEQLGQRVPGKDNSADLLAELRAQEERNQKALNDLRRQLFEMGSKRVNVIKFEILEENIERSRKLLEIFQEKLYIDPEFDCLVSLHPKVDQSIQLNEDSLMSVHNLESLTPNNQSKDNISVSSELDKRSSCSTCSQPSAPHTMSEDIHRHLSEFKNKLNYLSQNLPHHRNMRHREVEKPMNYPQPIIQQSLPPPPPQEKERKSYIYPVYYGSSLVAEISAMRQAYLQNGGNERDVLDQLSQMQAEAQRIEDEMKNTNYDNRHREKKPDLSGKMQMIEMENDRLHKELMLLQEQNFLNQNKRKSDREGKYEGQSYHKGQGHSYHKHLDHLYGEKSEHTSSVKAKWQELQFTKKEFEPETKDYWKIVNDTSKVENLGYGNPRKNISEKPIVPPLDLSSITGQKSKTTVLPPIQKEDGNNFAAGSDYTFITEKKNISKNRPKHVYGNQRHHYRNVLPDRPLPKINEFRDFQAKTHNIGRTQSLYVPRKKSGSHKGSIRSEIVGGNVDSYRYPMKHLMRKGSFAGTDLVGVVRASKPGDGHSKVTFDYYDPKTKNDMKYETVTIKQREELNPDNNHVVHTTTYKEEKLNGHVS